MNHSLPLFSHVSADGYRSAEDALMARTREYGPPAAVGQELDRVEMVIDRVSDALKGAGALLGLATFAPPAADDSP
jgi:hypothetical protein